MTDRCSPKRTAAPIAMLTLTLIAGAALMAGLTLMADSASAEPPRATAPLKKTDYDAWLKSCVDDHKHGALKRISVVGKSDDGVLVQGVFTSKTTRALFVGKETGECNGVFVAEAAGGLRGSFLGGKAKPVSAQVLEQSGECPGEDMGGCQAALLLQDAAGDIVGARPVGACPDSAVDQLVVFGKEHPSLTVSCTYATGGDTFAHKTTLHHVLGGIVVELASADRGQSQDAHEPKGCRYTPTGYLRVTTAGKAPVLAIFEPTDDQWKDGTLKALHWAGGKFEVKRSAAHTLTLKEQPMACKK